MAEEAIEQGPEGIAAKPRQSVPRRIAKWLIGGLIAIAVLVVVGIAVLNSPIGQRFIAQQIAKVAPASGLRVEVGRIDGDLFGEATLHDVVLLDPKGPFLTIPVAELDWRPLSWITSGLDIRNLTARRGTLLRLPELLPGDPDAPILPDFDIRIDRFQIDNLTVAPGVVGDKKQRVDLLAKADIRDGRVFLTADGTFGERDMLKLLVDAKPDGDTFDVDLDYRAPKGGVLAGMLGAQDGYRAVVTGKGSWSDWRGALLVKRNDGRLAAFRLTNRAGRYGILGQVDSRGVLSGLPAQALGKVSLAAFGTLEDSVLSGEMALRAAAVNANAEGTVDLAGNSFDGMRVVAQLTDPALFGPGLRLEDTRLTATLDGDFRDLSIEHDVRIARVVSGETIVSDLAQKGTATYDGTRWVLPLDGRIARIAVGNDLIDPRLVDGTLGGTVVYSGTRVLSDDLRIAFPGATARLSLRGETGQGAYALAGPVDVQGLPLENIGTVNANAKILYKMASGVPWTLRANFAGGIPKVSNATLANLAGPAIRFRGGIGLGGASPIVFRDVSLNAAKLNLTLDGRVAEGTTSLAGRGNHVDYGDFTVEAALAGSGPSAVLVFANPLPAAGLENVRVAISPTEEGFAIETEGGSLLGRFDGELGLFAPAGGPVRISVDRLDIWKTTLRGDIVLADGGPSGRLNLTGGGLDGTIALAPRGRGHAFDVNLTANNARFGGATPISIARARIEGSGLIVEGNSTVEGSVFAQGVSYGSFFLGRLAAQAKLENGSGTATASLSGRRGSRFNLQLNAGIAPERIAVAARGDYAGRRITMPRRAVLLKQGDGGYRLQPTQLTYGPGIAIVEGEVGGGTTAIDLQLANMPLSLVDVAIADMGLGGTISGLVDFRTTAGRVPTSSARVKVSGLTRSGLVLSSRPVDLALVMRLSAGQLEARAVIDENGQRRGRLQGQVTALPASGGLYDRLSAGRLDAQLRYSGPADALWRLTGVGAFDLTGPLSVAANARGTLADPSVSGSLASDGLRLRSSLSGTDIRDVSARGSFAGSRLRLTRFNGTAPNGGTVSGSGIVDLQDLGKRGPQLDIRIAARNAALLNAKGLTATVTGPLRIRSNGIGGVIAGRLAVARASWRLGRTASENDLPKLKTREVNLPADRAPARAARAPWRYLIDASADNQVDVDGLGLDSEWRADVRVRGTTDDPRIGGTARFVRGDYTFAGTSFELERGQIEFDEAVPINPRLDIRAETKRDGLDVTAAVRGTALEPEISFTSNPALPDEEILSRLLFGDSITNLSATDALQLAAAVASLQGGAGLDPINQLRSAIGLDRLRIVSADPALDRGTGVAVGKNFGRKVYVELITDGRGYSATSVEYRITAWLSLLASISTIGRESVVAEVSRDY